jgi:hypothetical protein
MRLVLLDEARFVDSMAMTISHRIAAIQAFKTLWRSVLKREWSPLWENPHFSPRMREIGHPDSRRGEADSYSMA